MIHAEQAVERPRVDLVAARRDLDRRIAEALAAALVARVLARRAVEPACGRGADSATPSGLSS